MTEDKLRGYEQIEKYFLLQKEKNESEIPQDNFEFQKALKADIVYTTIWFEREGCANQDLLFSN